MSAGYVIAKSKIRVFVPFSKKEICMFLRTCLGEVLKLGWLGWHQNVPYKTAEAKFCNWTSFLKLFCTRKSCSLQKVSQKLLKMTIIETWKLESGSQYSQRNFKKPVTYFKYRVECVLKICRPIFPVTSFLGDKSYLQGSVNCLLICKVSGDHYLWF